MSGSPGQTATREDAGTYNVQMQEDTVSLDELPDEDLMLRYGERGDLEAFEVLVLRHEKPLYNFILRTLGNEAVAQELLQETFIALIKKAADYKPTAKLTTFMYTIARNKCIDVFRKKRPATSIDKPLGGDGDEGPTLADRLSEEGAASTELEFEKQRFREALSVALQTLPDDQRTVFMLKEVSGLKFREIAEVENISLGTAKSRMRLAAEKLQAELGTFADSPLKEP